MTTLAFVDLHIHIGRTKTNRPVKITASQHLTLTRILEEASKRKGLDMVGVIDAHVPEVQEELQELIREGKGEELPGGGVRYNKTTLILGTEMELYDENCQGPVHVLCYFPTLEEMAYFSTWMRRHQKNIALSSQRSYVQARHLQQEVKRLGGLFVPAHIFTPYKSLYGRGVVRSLEEIFNPEQVDAVELGLSSDTHMADQLPELHAFTFLTNSDAHSLSKIGREYQQLVVDVPDFVHLDKALQRGARQRIAANYGLDPRLGKYHREVVSRLETLKEKQADLYPSSTGNKKGVPYTHPDRPPYVHQVPLEFIPGLGPKTLQQLIHAFGSEMNVLHFASKQELEKWVKPAIARTILNARAGKTCLQAGGAGKYGKVTYS